ncbi:UMP kinase [Candidatus Micrarchaeota archaeon]|nr:UMP kinase [Candidatus Micrarchaeota archaeon]
MLIVSLGGSLLFRENADFDLDYLKQIASIFANKDLAVVVGGGRTAKKYVTAGREFGAGEFECDTLAIRVTRMNARIITHALGEKAVYSANLTEAEAAAKNGKNPVLGGLLEGITTDAVSMLLAEKMGAKGVVNLSNIDYLYSGDPKTDKNAKKLEKIKHEELTQLAVDGDKRKARTNFPFDLVACRLAQRSNVELRFVDGKNLKEVEAALVGKQFKGTLVKD